MEKQEWKSDGLYFFPHHWKSRKGCKAGKRVSKLIYKRRSSQTGKNKLESPQARKKLASHHPKQLQPSTFSGVGARLEVSFQNKRRK